MDTKKQSIEKILKQINITSQRIKTARQKNDKVGYEIALKEHERLHKEYESILYGKREPTKVYEKKY